MATIFERCAARTYEILAIEKVTDDPHKAWQMAAPNFTDSTNVQRKPCPIATFCGLWYAGMIKGSTPRANYKVLRNAQYAVDGIKELEKNPHLSKFQVWGRIPGTNAGMKSQDGQMDVLFALRERGLIVGLP
jgi:hypothetical protein